jgi:predicted DNA-binding transcriptional regulator AlpA
LTEVLFTASVAFVVYVIYVLVKEQTCPAKSHIEDVQTGASTKVVKQPIPKPTRNRAKLNKERTKEKRTVTIILNLAESVGMAAGSIWRYLNEKGPTAVAKLVKELPEDNKTLQRSIGWLAQEDKISLETIGRVETIALKD